MAGGATVVLSSHVLEQVERLCGRVAILARGQLAALGPIEALRSEAGGGRTLEDIFFAAVGADEAAR